MTSDPLFKGAGALEVIEAECAEVVWLALNDLQDSTELFCFKQYYDILGPFTSFQQWSSCLICTRHLSDGQTSSFSQTEEPVIDLGGGGVWRKVASPGKRCKHTNSEDKIKQKKKECTLHYYS